MSVVRSTISFQKENWSHIEHAENRSQVVNEALQFFFHTKRLLEEQEQKLAIQELEHFQKTKEAYSYRATFDTCNSSSSDSHTSSSKKRTKDSNKQSKRP